MKDNFGQILRGLKKIYLKSSTSSQNGGRVTFKHDPDLKHTGNTKPQVASGPDLICSEVGQPMSRCDLKRTSVWTQQFTDAPRVMQLSLRGSGGQTGQIQTQSVKMSLPRVPAHP